MKKNTVSDGFRGIKLIGGLFALAAFFAPHPGYAQTTPSVTVTADDLGDLDAGDQGTASASVVINDPPQPSKEGSIDTTYSWSIDAVSSGQVTVDNVDAPTTTVHAEFDDPGDFYYEVTCTVTCHDNNNNQDYGPYTDSDWVGDPDDAGATQSASTQKAALASAAPQASGKQKRPTHVVLHFHVTSLGKTTHTPVTGPPSWGTDDYFKLGVILKGGKLFTKGTLNESFPIAQYKVNPLYASHFPTPPTPQSSMHPLGSLYDHNRVLCGVDTTQIDPHIFSLEQDFSNTGPDAKCDNYHTLIYDATGVTRTVH